MKRILLLLLIIFSSCRPSTKGPNNPHALLRDLLWVMPANARINELSFHDFHILIVGTLNSNPFEISIQNKILTHKGQCQSTSQFTICSTPYSSYLIDQVSPVISSWYSKLPSLHPILFLRLFRLLAGLSSVILLFSLLLFAYRESSNSLLLSFVLSLFLIIYQMLGINAPIHANYHGIAEAQAILTGFPYHLEGFSKGPVWYYLMSGLLPFFVSYNTLFFINSLFISLAATILLATIYRFSKSFLTSFLVTTIFALNPYTIALAATEAPQALIIFVTALGIYFLSNEEIHIAMPIFAVVSILFFESIVIFLLPFIWLLLYPEKRNILKYNLFYFVFPGVVLLWFAMNPVFFTSIRPPLQIPQSILTDPNEWLILLILILALLTLFFYRTPLNISCLTIAMILYLGALSAQWPMDNVRYRVLPLFLFTVSALPLINKIPSLIKSSLIPILIAFMFVFRVHPGPTQHEFYFIQHHSKQIHAPVVMVHPYHTKVGLLRCAFAASLIPQSIVIPFNDELTGIALNYYGLCMAIESLSQVDKSMLQLDIPVVTTRLPLPLWTSNVLTGLHNIPGQVQKNPVTIGYFYSP